MNKKEKIIKILLDNQQVLKKEVKEQESIMNKLNRKKKKEQWEYETISSCNYTIGYCTAIFYLTKNVVSLLNMSKVEIEEMEKKNKKISKENKKTFKAIFDKIRKR